MNKDQKSILFEKKFRRKRTRTNKLRKEIRDVLDRALCDPESSTSAFISKEFSYTPLSLISSILHLDFSKLSPKALAKLGFESKVFEISSDGLALRLRPNAPAHEDCTIYLDNLPREADSEIILNMAKEFGTVWREKMKMQYKEFIIEVVSVRVPSPRDLRFSNNRGFAFVRFTEPSAVNAMCLAHRNNFDFHQSEIDAEFNNTTNETNNKLYSEINDPQYSTTVEMGKKRQQKRRRIRKRIPICEKTKKLKNSMAQIQVLPLYAIKLLPFYFELVLALFLQRNRYREFRRDYLQLQRAKMCELKKVLRKIDTAPIRQRWMRGKDKVLFTIIWNRHSL